MDMKKQAKIDVLKELMQVAKDAQKSKVKSGLDEMKAQKVTVAAPDKESLLKGLEKAEDVLESSMPEEMEKEESSEEMEEEMSPMSLENKSLINDDKEELLKSMMEEEDEDFSLFSKPKKKKSEDEEEDEY